MISIKIKDPLFTYRARLLNILDFNPKKLSVEKVCAINDEQEHIYCIKYGGDPFYLVINDLKGYFKYSKNPQKNNRFSNYLRDHGIIVFDIRGYCKYLFYYNHY